MGTTECISKPSMVSYTAKGRHRTRETRPSGALWFFDILGVIIVALFFNNWARWLQSTEFKPSDPGPDPYPYILVLRATEASSVAVFTVIGIRTILLPLHTRGCIGLDGKLFIGGVFASTLDIMFAVFNPTWAMNAHAVAHGSWANSIPGWLSPGASKIPWGLLWCLPAYIWLGVGAAIIGCNILGGLRSTLPRTPEIFAYTVVQVCYMIVFTALATFWNRTQVYTYVSIPRGLSLWYGSIHQLPLYEPFLIGMYCMGYTWLRDTRDLNDRCAIDREVDSVTDNRILKELLSTLAICGWAAATTILGYMVPFSWFAMFGDGHPVLPSYLQSGIYCGQPGTPLCPGQYLHHLRYEELFGGIA